MDFTLIATYGPSLQNEDTLRAISELGNVIFRINGAHVIPTRLKEVAEIIHSTAPHSKIMLDLPGNKVRLQNLGGEIPINKGETVGIRCSQLNYPQFWKYIKKGDVALTHDSRYSLEVVDANPERIKLMARNSGYLLPNKGLHVEHANKELPFLFEKDRALINSCIGAPIDILSLSFVRSGSDIREVKELLKETGQELELFSKVETSSATENLGEIFEEVDTINVDRGDLSADIGLIRLPMVQERIIESAKRAEKKVFLATQFLHNMETNPVPLIAEISDLFRTVKSGVCGIQLSEETAVGRYPLEAASLIMEVYRRSFSSL